MKLSQDRNQWSALVNTEIRLRVHKLLANSGEPFTISTKIIRKMEAAIGKNKSRGPDNPSGEIIKLRGKAMISFLRDYWT
jgi:hypothetical protein